MTIHLPRPHGRHRAVDRVREMEAANARLGAENTDLACMVVKLTTQLDTAGIELSGLRLDHEEAVTEIRRLQQQHIGDAITIARLRRELHDTRPRIAAVPATAERPTAPDSVPQPYQTVKEVA